MTPKQKTDVLRGTRVLMVLKTLGVLGLHPVFPKLEQQGANTFCGGTPGNNRRARLTREGRKPFQVETHDWEQTAAIIARFFKAKAEDWT